MSMYKDIALSIFLAITPLLLIFIFDADSNFLVTVYWFTTIVFTFYHLFKYLFSDNHVVSKVMVLFAFTFIYQIIIFQGVLLVAITQPENIDLPSRSPFIIGDIKLFFFVIHLLSQGHYLALIINIIPLCIFQVYWVTKLHYSDTSSSLLYTDQSINYEFKNTFISYLALFPTFIPSLALKSALPFLISMILFKIFFEVKEIIKFNGSKIYS